MCTFKKLLWSFLIISTGTISSSTAQKINIKHLVGVPFLTTNTFSDAEIKSKINRMIMDKLAVLQNWNPRYDTLQKNMAIAIGTGEPQINGFVPMLYRHNELLVNPDSWGCGWGYKTIDSAVNGAMKECQTVSKTMNNFPCFPFIVNGKVTIPDSFIKGYKSERALYIKSQTQELLVSPKFIAIDRSLNLIKSQKHSTAERLYVPKPVRVGYIDEQQDYSSACRDLVFYALLPVDKPQINNYINKLKKLQSSGLYGSYDRSINTTGDYKKHYSDRLMERISLFTENIKYKKDPIKDGSLVLPTNLNDALKDEIIQEIWIESGVRVTPKNKPLENQEFAQPLAIQTNRGFYIGVEIHLLPKGPNNYGCYVSKPFTGKVLNISSCIGNQKNAELVLATFFDNIQKNFTSNPIGAVLERDVFPPGEFWMERNQQPSLILGNPYYEKSTYTIQTWTAYADDPSGSLYLRQNFKGLGDKRIFNGTSYEKTLFIYLKVSHILEYASHKNSDYGSEKDTEDQFNKKYDSEIQRAIQKAINETCTALKGKMKLSICELPTK